MTKNATSKEYNQFYVDLLNAKFNGKYTEEEIVEKLNKLIKYKDPNALKAMAEVKLAFAPDKRTISSVYDKGSVASMTNVANPTQSGPAGTDHFGLYRDPDKRK